jgi:hypothetical protein
MFKNITISILLLIIVLFDYNSKSNNNIEISGIIVDGYIKDATICLDMNLNGLCNYNEKTTITDINGNFKFTNINKSDNFASIIGSGGIDTATNKPLKGQMKTIIKLDSDKKVFVTPVTDIIASSFILSSVKSIDTLNNIETTIANNLGLNISKIYNDPMKDKYLFAKAQEIMFLKSLIKDLSNEDDITISNAVSKSFLNKSPNEYISILEIFKNMNVIVNDNSIKYAQDEYLSLKKIIKNTILDKKIDIKMLDLYQNLINELIILIKNNTKDKDSITNKVVSKNRTKNNEDNTDKIIMSKYINTIKQQDNTPLNKILVKEFVSNINTRNDIDIKDDNEIIDKLDINVTENNVTC